MIVITVIIIIIIIRFLVVFCGFQLSGGMDWKESPDLGRDRQVGYKPVVLTIHTHLQ
jgi:hypothetical protein